MPAAQKLPTRMSGICTWRLEGGTPGSSQGMGAEWEKERRASSMMRSGPTVRVRRRRDWELGPLGKKVVT